MSTAPAPAATGYTAHQKLALLLLTLWEAAKYLWAERPAYRHLFAAAGIAAMPGYSLLVWTPSLFSRHFLASTDRHMARFAVRLRRGDWHSPVELFGQQDGQVLDRSQPGASYCRLLPGRRFFSISMTFAPSRDLALLLLLIPAIGYCCHIAPLYGVIHAIIQNRVRSRAIAFLLLAANIAGFGLGPLFAGLVSDYLSERLGAASLSYALMIIDTSTPAEDRVSRWAVDAGAPDGSMVRERID